MCPNAPPVEFSCTGVNVNFLEWRNNGSEIQPNFDISDSESAPKEVISYCDSDIYTLYLDEVSVNNAERVGNITTRLLANISSLNSGYPLSCTTQFRVATTFTLNFTIRGNAVLILFY